MTTAHLFGQSGGGAAAGTAAAGAAVSQRGPGGRTGAPGHGWAHVVCWARVAWSSTKEAGKQTGGLGAMPDSGVTYRWLRAQVLWVWSNHLDLALLQLEAPYDSRIAVAGVERPPLALAAVRASARARPEEVTSPFDTPAGAAEGPVRVVTFGDKLTADGGGAASGPRVFSLGSGSASSVEGAGLYGSGTPVWAVGHSLVGPAAEWPPLVSHGCVTRVLRRRCGRPTMVIATTTTHAGGSGGALLDGQGHLVGLVTSNARHAGGATLANMAFCIAAEELEPVLRWAAAWGGSHGGSDDGGGEGDRGRGSASSGLVPSVAELAAADDQDGDAAR
ncbi:hypothetical protein GPECTOR_7g1133 [Gonium pectorale]|uniref:Peptidase S1 domain-containing protein n=1 Tax=Gonium pectorale TaxID=33097 RepID=A0A150GTT0_GONPE|nr:hypothetical protein GPECTOR_7g1133 [Gonium pectorale]|eukprot:KXZ53239.1 hypothetical protein GPECTOR_7g1133 [Gonium pectorale]